MKSLPLFFGFFLFSFLLSFSAKAAEENGLSVCELAWTSGFENAENRLTSVELPPFLQQNAIAGSDLWAGYRKMSLRHECLLRSVCAIATDGKMGEDFLGTKNKIGGVVPGEFYDCPTDATEGSETEVFEMTFESYLSSSGISPDEIHEKCYPEDFVFEKSELMNRANECALHRQVSVEIFDRALQKMILRDVNRKRGGFLNKKISALVVRIREVNENLASFVANANAYLGKSGTLSHTN